MPPWHLFGILAGKGLERTGSSRVAIGCCSVSADPVSADPALMLLAIAGMVMVIQVLLLAVVSSMEIRQRRELKR
jgi:hypothetical protein